MILETYTSGPILTNCALLGCSQTKKGAIIDAPPGSADLFLDRIKELGLDVKMLLLTHSHWDHTTKAACLKEKLGLAVYVHELDAENLKAPGSDGLPLMVEVAALEPDHLLKDGQRIKVGTLTLEVIHTPGHTPGGVCFYLKEENILFSGDTLFKGTIGNLGLATAESEKMWESLEKLTKLPPNTRVIPGHGEETTIGEETWLTNAKEYFGG